MTIIEVGFKFCGDVEWRPPRRRTCGLERTIGLTKIPDYYVVLGNGLLGEGNFEDGRVVPSWESGFIVAALTVAVL